MYKLKKMGKLCFVASMEPKKDAFVATNGKKPHHILNIYTHIHECITT